MLAEKLTRDNGISLGYHRNTVDRLISRGAVVIDGKVYAPVKKRARNSSEGGKELS